MRMQDVLIKPVVTEKALGGNAQNVYVFQVNTQASKNQVKEVIEKIFKVEVNHIRSITKKGKTRRVGKKMKIKKMPNTKKVYITLKKGKIDIVPSSS